MKQSTLLFGKNSVLIFAEFLTAVRAFYARSQNCEKPLLASSCPSVRKELGSHSTDFHEIFYLRTFRKSVHKIQVSLKSNRNKGYFTWRPIYIFDHISLISS